MTLAPLDLIDASEESGFFQCPTCGIVWFGRPDVQTCICIGHETPVHVVVICGVCDLAVPANEFAMHIASKANKIGTISEVN